MRCLVTGGTGFVGSHTARGLRADGHDVRLLVRDQAKAERLFAADVELVVGDVSDPAVVAAALDGVDAVVHCAAVVATDVPLTGRRSCEMQRTNVGATESVIGGAVERGVDAVVYLSSQTALFTPGEPISAQSGLGVGHGAYAHSKVAGERYVRSLQARGAPICTLYPPGVIGPDDPGLSEGNRAVRGFLSRLVPVTTSGYEVVDVRDLATLAAMMAIQPRPGRHVVGGGFLRWPDLVALLDELTGRRVRRMRLPGGFLRVMGHAADRVSRIMPVRLPLSVETMEYGTMWPEPVASQHIPGFCRRDVSLSYADTIRWLHRAGYLSDRQAGNLAH